MTSYISSDSGSSHTCTYRQGSVGLTLLLWLQSMSIPVRVLKYPYPLHLLTVFMPLFRNICKTDFSLSLPTSPGLDAAISQSLGIRTATCCAWCIVLEETAIHTILLVWTPSLFVSSSSEVPSLMQLLSLDYGVNRRVLGWSLYWGEGWLSVKLIGWYQIHKGVLSPKCLANINSAEIFSLASLSHGRCSDLCTLFL